MDIDQPAAPLDIALPDSAENPADIIDQAVELDMASAERERREVTPEERALVHHWWQATSETNDFTSAVNRQLADEIVLDGGKPEQIADPAECTVQHVYRNGIQTVALMVPGSAAVTWKARQFAEPIPGMAEPVEQQDARRKAMGLASVCTTLFRRFAEASDFDERSEAWIQDSVHFRAGITKIWWQRDLATDVISRDRLADQQDQLALLRTLIEQYDQGEFGPDDVAHRQMTQLMASLDVSEADVQRGLVIETVPLGQYRIDPAVTGPEHKRQARWERHDILMQRDEILAQWDHISYDDLQGCVTVSVDEQGRWLKQAMQDRTDSSRDTLVTNRQLTDRTPGSLSGGDWLLVAEIYDFRTNTRLVLVEGLEFPAVEEPIQGGSPFVALVLNRRARSFYGYSDTEMQAKLQDARNRMRGQEEAAREAAQPRWAYNPAVINDPKTIHAIQNAKPGEMVPVPIPAGEDLSKNIMPLAGNHEFRQEQFDDSKLSQEQDKMAMMPEATMGVSGKAKFAAEIEAGTAGGAALARYRQVRINRSYKQLCDRAMRLILANCPMELAIKYAGPIAAEFYPQHPLDRNALYDGLTIEVEVALDKNLDSSEKTRLLVQFAEIMQKMGVRFDAEAAGKMLGQLLGLGDSAKALIVSDPNDLIGRLANAMQTGEIPLVPESLAALQHIFTAAQQQAAQMMAQAMQQGVPGQPGQPQMPQDPNAQPLPA
jgi:hypothetical protein